MNLVQCAKCGREYNSERLSSCPRCRANASAGTHGSSIISEREAVISESVISEISNDQYPSKFRSALPDRDIERWEYRIEDLTITDKWNSQKRADEFSRFSRVLNQLGSQGWELMSYEAIPLVGNWSKDIKGYAYLAMLKRRLYS
jgi:hypothetical protein